MNQSDLDTFKAMIDKEILCKNLEGKLLNYVKWAYRKKKKEPFIVNHHHEIICKALEDVFYGRIKNLILNLPPRYSKTEIAIKGFVEWCLAKHADCNFIHLSYSDTLALDNSSEIREDIKSEWYQEHWPLKTKSDKDMKKMWQVEGGGGVYATTTLGSITGFGAGKMGSERFSGAILIDDPLKPDEAYSDLKRKAANNRLNTTILSRRNDPKKTPIIIIMQRLHEDDMSGFCINGGTSEKFTVVSIPAIDSSGQPLWPEKHTLAELLALKAADRRMFAGQYMQQPAPEEGALFKRQWFKFYNERPARFNTQIQSWDFAVKAKTTSDYTVGLVLGRVGADIYVLDMIRDKLTFPESCQAVVNLSNKWRNTAKKLIEDKANGSPILDTLKKTVPGMVAVMPIADKVTRANAVLPTCEAGNVYFPNPDTHPWVHDIIEELCLFPNAKHDDIVDAFSMGVKELQNAPIVFQPITGHGSGTIY